MYFFSLKSVQKDNTYTFLTETTSMLAVPSKFFSLS